MNEARLMTETAIETRAHPRRSGFYMALAFLLVTCVVAGFWPTYYGAVLGTGIALAAYGVLVAVFGLYASVQLELHRYSFTHDLDLSARRLFLSLSTIGLFAGLLAAAIRCRRQPELHKRLMVVASCSLASPGVTRLGSRVLDLPLSDQPVLMQLFLLIPLLLCAAHDMATRGKIHPVILLGALLNLLLFNHGPFARTEFWLSIGRAVLRPFI
jgi:hypothetical protein